MDRTVGAVDHADLQQVPGGVGANEHRQAIIQVIDEDWVVEGVDHVVVADAVLASARGDQRSIHTSQVSLHSVRRQVVLRSSAPVVVPYRAGRVHRPATDPHPDSLSGRATGSRAARVVDAIDPDPDTRGGPITRCRWRAVHQVVTVAWNR